MAMLMQRRMDGRGFTRIAGVAAARSDVRPLEFAAAELLRGTGRHRDALQGDGRVLVRWIDGSEDRVAIVVTRRATATPFRRHDVDAIDANLPWLEDLAAIWRQNQRAAARLDGLRAAFGLRGTGAILLDSRGSILEINEQAKRLLARHTGLLRSGEQVTAELPGDALRLAEAIRAVVAAALTGQRIAPRQLSVRRGEGGAALHLSVMRPFEAAALKIDPGDPTVLLLVVDPRAAAAPVTGVCSLYGLTPAQSRLTRRLVEGESLAEAAAVLGLTCETARTYLKQVFAKTGVRRQANLVRMMLMGQVPSQRSRSYPRDATRTASRPPIHIVQREKPQASGGPARSQLGDAGQFALELC